MKSPELDGTTRRTILRGGAGLALSPALARLARAAAWGGSLPQSLPIADGRRGPVEFTVASYDLMLDGRRGDAVAINNSVPAPVLILKEGTEAVIRVTNRLREISSIHWHGVLVPPTMDGVPGVSFAGIAPGETFEYRFPVRQSGTYWYHSHSGGQALMGMYGPLVIEPAGGDPVAFDREHTILLSDFSYTHPMTLLSRLKKQGNYYNQQRRTVGEFFSDARRDGLGATIRERAMWAKMRMDPTDLADVTGGAYTYLTNGRTPRENWTAIFAPGETVRLRFVDGAAMTHFDVRIPGLKLTIVAVDGQNVRPVAVDEFRIAPGETYDVIVTPGDQPYTIFAETLDRIGYARGTLAPRLGMEAMIPPRRRRAVRTMADMGMDMGMMSMDGGKSGVSKPSGDMKGMPGMKPEPQMPDMPGMPGMKDMPGMKPEPPMPGMKGMPGMKPEPQMPGMNGMPGMKPEPNTPVPIPGAEPVPHTQGSHGVENSMAPMATRSRLDEPGIGLGNDGWKVLVYTDLVSLAPREDRRPPAREVTLHITGNMERYIWGFDGKKYSEAPQPIPFQEGERLRFTLLNDTMMEHPIHLHGMFMELENGQDEFRPLKHTINVKPSERVSLLITPDVPGPWAMHCHLLLHMEAGMFRVVRVADRAEAPAPTRGSR